jgi:hypothetical protein
MKEINLPSGDYLFVEVPEFAYNFQLSSYVSNNFKQYLFIVYSSDKPNILELGESNCSYDLYGEIISTTKYISDEQAGSIVEHQDLRYKNYKTFRWYSSNKGKSFRAKKSLQSLIQANGLDVNKNYLILKRL